MDAVLANSDGQYDLNLQFGIRDLEQMLIYYEIVLRFFQGRKIFDLSCVLQWWSSGARGHSGN